MFIHSALKSFSKSFLWTWAFRSLFHRNCEPSLSLDSSVPNWSSLFWRISSFPTLTAGSSSLSVFRHTELHCILAIRMFLFVPLRYWFQFCDTRSDCGRLGAATPFLSQPAFHCYSSFALNNPNLFVPQNVRWIHWSLRNVDSIPRSGPVIEGPDLFEHAFESQRLSGCSPTALSVQRHLFSLHTSPLAWLRMLSPPSTRLLVNLLHAFSK